MTKSAYNDEALDKVHIQSRLENMLHPEREGASEREFGMLEAMDDDEHLSRLRNISTESIFIDLLNTDEFLKKQDPEAVLEAYNDILEVNPSIRGKKMPLRQALREYLATESLDLATIGQLEKMENDSATRRDAKEKTMAEQASRFAQTQQKREQDVRELELKKKDMEMRESEAKERVREFEKEMQRKKKEMKARKKEFEELKKERAEQFKYQKEHDTIRDELAAKQFEHQKEQDTTRNELASQQFEHQKEQDKTRNDLASEQFKHQKAQDSTKNKLEQTKAENQKTVDEYNMTLKQISEKARELEALLGLQEKANYNKTVLDQKASELATKNLEARATIMQALSQTKGYEAQRLREALEGLEDVDVDAAVREFLGSSRLDASIDIERRRRNPRYDPLAAALAEVNNTPYNIPEWLPNGTQVLYSSPISSFIDSTDPNLQSRNSTAPTPSAYDALKFEPGNQAAYNFTVPDQVKPDALQDAYNNFDTVAKTPDLKSYS